MPIIAKTGMAYGLCFAGYALVIAVIFPFVFRYKHNCPNLKHAISNTS